MTLFSQYSTQEKALFLASFLMLVVFVLQDQYITPFLVLFAFATLPFFRWKVVKEGSLLLLLVLLFYILYAISIFYSSNKNEIGPQMMTKLSYLVFPVFILHVQNASKVILKSIKWGLIVGSTLSMVVSFLRAVFIEGGISGDAFKADAYGFNMHPSYLALIFIISATMLWKTELKSRFSIIAKLAFSGLVVLTLFYLRSLGAFVCLAGMAGIIPVWDAIKRKNWKWLLILPGYMLVILIAIKSSPKIANDVNTSFDKLTGWMKSPEQFLFDNKNITESNTVRLVTWTLSSRIVCNNPLGIGIGDVNDRLEWWYREYGYTYYVYDKLNPHNQYIQTSIAVGWIGGLLLVVIFFIMARLSFISDDLPMFIAATSMFLSCLFESMLERQVGVILMCILVMYIVMKYRDYKEKASLNES